MKITKKQYRLIFFSSILSFLVFFLPEKSFAITLQADVWDAEIALYNQLEISWRYFTQIINFSIDFFFVYLILYVLIYKPVVKPLLKI
ncbi:hypothetical protein KAI92_00720 [Candidatus Parcubacteria bacterium]|nr:hypothetical protein [Candidatus Parcubacteria bacterium]